MKIKTIFQATDATLKCALRTEMLRRGYTELHHTKDFLYAEGDAPYMLVAHLDTVHTEVPSIICYSNDRNYMMSPQGIGGDDRCGVYIILSLLNRLPFKPYILFTMAEEKGGLGAKAFIEYAYEHIDIPDLKYIVEYDRKGNNDCVFYNCDNNDFVDFVESFGFKKAYGSFSDISVVAPEFGAAAVNLSSGYFNPHTKYEYVCVSDMHDIIERSVEMLCTECDGFEYIEKPVKVYKYTPKTQQQGQQTTVYGTPDPRYKRVRATILPANSVWLDTYKQEGKYPNNAYEIAVDAEGHYYRYYACYHDWEEVYAVTPIQESALTKFDDTRAFYISVYNYAYYDDPYDGY